ncbi:MAG: arylsulfatase [Beutenbergiaceae bacterium]
MNDTTTTSRAAGSRFQKFDRPNVMLICVDQMRGDALSALGHPVVRTPHLDQIAAQGTLFRHAYSATPTCVPARVALLTGQSQERHGRTGYRDGVPFQQAHPVTLPGVLGAAGYQTKAIGKMHVFPERARCGFDDVLLHDGFLHYARRSGARNLSAGDDYIAWLRRQPGSTPDAEDFDDGVGCNSMVAAPWNRPEHLHPTNWVASQTIDWLGRRDPTAPFFCYVSFHRPHAPLNPPGWAFEDYLHREPSEPPRGDWITDFEDFRRDDYHQTVFGRLDPVAHHRAVAGYYGLISHIDLQINRILEALSDYELLDDTAILFVSDHGDMMGDHDMYRKSVGFEGSARVPFIVRPAPRFTPDAPQGQVVDEVTELRDVMPTVLAMAGVEIPDSVDGLSVAGHAAGTPPPGWRTEIHGEHVHFSQSMQWVTDGKRKYLWASEKGLEQFFDLEADPKELRNLIDDPDRADEIEGWRQRLIAYLNGREEGFVAGGELVTGRPVRTERSDITALVT